MSTDSHSVALERPLQAPLMGAPDDTHTPRGTPMRTGMSRTLMAGLTELPEDSSINACSGLVFWLFSGGLVLIVAGVVMALIMETTVIIVGVACVGFGFLLMLGGIGYERYRHSERF